MRLYFLQEILKLLDMDKDHLFHGSNNLDLVLKEMKQVITLNEFKTKLKI